MAAGDVAKARAKKLAQLRTDSMKDGAKLLRKSLVESAKRATGGDSRLSGLGNEPRLGVSVRFQNTDITTSVVIKPSPKRAYGPWVWIDSGTRAGVRGRKGRVAPRRNDRTYVTKQRRPYYHPGTKGSDAWFGTVDRELPKIRSDIRNRFVVASR